MPEDAERCTERCTEGPMGPMAVWEQQVGRPVPPGFRIKRTHLNRRREFPYGVPRPYAWPQPTFLGACVDEAREQREHPWDAVRLLREWVEQELKAIRQALAGIIAPQPADHSRLLAHERLALDLPRVFPPRGGTDKRIPWLVAEREFKKHGIKTSRPVYFAARKHLRELLARTTSDQS
jgi:hypothetical protein